MKLPNYLLAGAAAIGLMFAASSAQAGLVLSIDEFDGPDQVADDDGTGDDMRVEATLASGAQTAFDNEKTPGEGTHTADAGIIGGYRDIKTEVFSASSGGQSIARVFVSGGIGSFSHEQAQGMTSQTDVTWNGLDTANGGDSSLNGEDLSKYSKIKLKLDFADGEIFWEFVFTDSNNLTASGYVQTFSTTTPEILFVDLASLTTDAGFLWSSIDSILLKANVEAPFGPNAGNRALAFDTGVDYIRLVDAPEPATLSVLGAGLIGLGVAARRRRRS